MTNFQRTVFKMVESIQTSGQLVKFMNKYGLTEEPEIQKRLLQLRYSEIASSEDPDPPNNTNSIGCMLGWKHDLELVMAKQSSNQEE